jgi:hypothetical protein
LAFAHFSGNVNIYSNASQSSSVAVAYGSVGGDVRINTGGGNDNVSVSSHTGRNLTIHTNGGNDVVNVGPALGGGDNVRLNIGGRLTLNTGDNDDWVSLDRVSADTLFVNLGAGDDQLVATAVSVKRTVSVDGGTGRDYYATPRSTENVFRGLKNFEGRLW